MIFFLFACQTGLDNYQSDYAPYEEPSFANDVEDSSSMPTPEDSNLSDDNDSDEATIDGDGDGFTSADGDCDDTDNSVYPNAVEQCDQIDNDCNGLVDENIDEDDLEPNDFTAINLGEFSENNVLSVRGTLSDESDIDRFELYIDDPPGGWFVVNVSLYAESGETDYVVELWKTKNENSSAVLLSVSDETSFGGEESITHRGIPLVNDGGLYQVVVYASEGGSCDSTYEISIDFSV